MQRRRQKITEMVNREGQITFARLKQEFSDVSEMTLRTDLKYLDEQGVIIRIHGGAKSIETVVGTDGLLENRNVRNQELKLQIAQKAAALLHSRNSIFIDSGSTMTMFSKYIPDEPRQIFTSGISCATELAALQHASVQMLGGRLNRYSLSVAGSRSVLELQSYNFDICFLGVTSFDPKTGFCCESEADCVLKQVAISRSAYTAVLMDSSKFGLVNTHCICPPKGVNAVVTDDGLTKEQRACLEEQGIVVF